MADKEPAPQINLSLTDANMKYIAGVSELMQVPMDEVLNRCVAFSANMSLALMNGMFFAESWQRRQGAIEAAAKAEAEAKAAEEQKAGEPQVELSAEERLKKLREGGE